MPELHLPGYQFCGPFTKLDERLAKGQIGINKLDALCRNHDLAYKYNKSVDKRHIHDKILQQEAAEIYKDSSNNLSQRLNAGLISNIMFAKRRLGLGTKK